MAPILRTVGGWCNFNILRDGEIAPNFAKNVTVPSFGAPNGSTCENGKIFRQNGDNCPTFWWKLLTSPFTYFRGSGRITVQVSFKSTTRFTIVSQMAPQVPSGRNDAMENVI